MTTEIYNISYMIYHNLIDILSGSLMTKDLADLVKADDFVLESEYLQTLLVVVPKSVFTLFLYISILIK